MSGNNQQHVEVVWGNQILDEGFTTIPNLIIKNYSKVGLTHGEFALLTIMFSFKHDANDPYPSQETLARIFYGDSYRPESSLRALRKLLKSIEDKELLEVSYRYKDGKRVSNQYNFSPLIEACLKFVKQKDHNPVNEIKVAKKRSNKGKKLEEQKVPVVQEQKVPVDDEPEVPVGKEQKVPTKKKREKDQYKKKIEKESIYLEELNNLDIPTRLVNALKDKIDRLILHKVKLSDIELLFKQHRNDLSHIEYESILMDVLDAEKYNYGFKRYMSGAIKRFLGNRVKRQQEQPDGQASGGRKEMIPEFMDEDRKKKEISDEERKANWIRALKLKKKINGEDSLTEEEKAILAAEAI